MTPLKKALDSISTLNNRLFSGEYSINVDDFEFYEADSDEISTFISGVVGTTQQIFTLTIKRDGFNGSSRPDYLVKAKYFKELESEALVSGDKLLDFLINAKIEIDPDLRFVYNPS